MILLHLALMTIFVIGISLIISRKQAQQEGLHLLDDSTVIAPKGVKCAEIWTLYSAK